MRSQTMMDSFTRYSKKHLPEAVVRLVVLLCLSFAGGAWGQAAGEIQQLRVERLDDDIVLSAQMQFDLPSSVEEVLAKGVPIAFTAEAEVYRERWYWFDKRLAYAQRTYRLAFQPLSRRWRVTVAGPVADSGAALSLNQNFESLTESLGYIKRIARWRIADASALDPTVRYRTEFRYRLDVSQLALPMQIGTLGQSDWNVTLSATASLSLDAPR